MTETAALTRMRLTTERGTDFWNDSCALDELREAVDNGAVGATSNPVIVYTVYKQDQKTWQPVLDELVARQADASEDDLAWLLIETIGKRAAAILEPVHRATSGKQGFLSMQVNPK